MIKTSAPLVKSRAVIRKDFPFVDVMWRPIGSVCVQEQPMDQFQSQKLMKLRGEVSRAGQVILYHRFNASGVQIRPRQGAFVEQDLTDVIRKPIAIPDAIVIELMPAEEQAL